MTIIEKFAKLPSRAKAWWVFGLVMIFTVSVALVTGGDFYNKTVSQLSEKTKGTITLPKIDSLPFSLGLDLQGGTHLVYQANVAGIPELDRASALDSVRDVIERRVNVFGVSEPLVEVNRSASGEYRIIAELAGIKDVNEAIKQIGATPLLEFKEKGDGTINITPDQTALITNDLENLKKIGDQIINEAKGNKDFSALAKKYSKEAVYKDLGWVDVKNQPNAVKAIQGLKKGEVSKNLVETTSGFAVFKLVDVRQKANAFNDQTKKAENEYHILALNLDATGSLALPATDALDNWKNTELSGKYLKKSSLEFSQQDGSAQVALEFNSDGAKLFEDITARNIGKPVAIVLDGSVISAPNVNEKITGGRAVISGTFSVSEAKTLVKRLNSGALPVPISLISQKTVEASLGDQAIASSLLAGLIGLLLVSIFMIIYYRLPGLLAVLSLFIYGLTVLTVFKALPIWFAFILVAVMIGLLFYTFNELKIFSGGVASLFLLIGVLLFVYAIKPITLTLSGIAGFILSIGMAVDANILIFERIKEELRLGKSVTLAVDEGFRRAWPSIRDGNTSTILTCFILMFFGTSVVQGFGTALFIGIAVSLFSAIVVTRTFFLLVLGKYLEKYPWLLGVRAKKEN